MKSDRLNQWLSLAANFGVIAGLVLLFFELRQTNTAIIGATYQQRTEENVEWQKWLAESEYLMPSVFGIRQSGLESLPALARTRTTSAMIGAMHKLDGEYFQYELGLLTEDYYETHFLNDMRTWVPRWREFGLLDGPNAQYVRPTFAREIERFVDDEVRW